MNAHDIRMLLQQNINNLKFQSGSGSVNLPVLISYLEMEAQFVAEAWDNSRQAMEEARATRQLVDSINRKLAELQQKMVMKPPDPVPDFRAGGGFVEPTTTGKP